MIQSLILSLACFAAAAQPVPEYGVLLLAHGGNAEWNAEVSAIAKEAAGGAPVSIAFGMADADAIQKAASELEARSCRKIVAVPLFVNSASEVMEQTRYVLGISEKPSEVLRDALHGMAGHHGGHAMGPLNRRVRSRAPVILTPALDDHPLVAETLLARAKALSRAPSREIVLLVGHGPVDEAAEKAWTRTMTALAAAVRERGGFKAVVGRTLRDDAPKPVRDKAVAALRETVSKAALEGKVLVVPYLVARGGIEAKVKEALRGLSYAWDGRTICPHPNVSRWVLEMAAAGAKKEDMRRFR
jgi:sirohydrochlorin cobaltochelatase